MNLYVGLIRRGAHIDASKNVADPPSLSWFHLFSDPGILGSQWLGPDLFCLARVRARVSGPMRALHPPPPLL